MLRAGEESVSVARHPHLLRNVHDFYESPVVIDTFNDGFAGRWHTRIVPDGDGPKCSEDFVAQLLGLESRHRLLDFGCGVGVVALSLASKTGCSVRGVNISSRQLEAARRMRDELGLQSLVEFDLSAGRSLPYPDESFDRIVFLESVCHVPDKQALARELFRVLRPGGVLAGQDWLVTEADLSQAEYDDWVRPIEASCEVSLETLEAYRNLLERAGFEQGLDARRPRPLPVHGRCVHPSRRQTRSGRHQRRPGHASGQRQRRSQQRLPSRPVHRRLRARREGAQNVVVRACSQRRQRPRYRRHRLLLTSQERRADQETHRSLRRPRHARARGIHRAGRRVDRELDRSLLPGGSRRRMPRGSLQSLLSLATGASVPARPRLSRAAVSQRRDSVSSTGWWASDATSRGSTRWSPESICGPGPPTREPSCG